MPYRDDLARIHDARFGEIARSSAPVLLEVLERAWLEEGLVIDLGCGSGIFAEPIAAAGYDVLGVDDSGPMLRLLHRRLRGRVSREDDVPSIASRSSSSAGRRWVSETTL